MKHLTLITLILATVAAGTGCGSSAKKPTAVTPTEPTDPVGPTTEAKPSPPIGDDVPVSGGLALGADIATACGIKPSTDPKPTFDYDKDELSPEDREVLTTLATCVTTGALKGRNLRLIGRADPRGTEEYNMGLGSRRASSVSSFLAHLGVSDPQLDTTTRGALEAEGTDEAGWAHDRRVDIQLKTE